MKNVVFAISIFIALTAFSCSNRQDVFPDIINVTKTDSHIRLKGSKLFVKVPADYQPVTSLIRYQKTENTYFQVVEMPDANFREFKSKMTEDAIESQGAEVEVHETVNFNGLEGLYFEGPSKKQGETKIGLAFGDDSFVTMILGVFVTSDKSSGDELRSIFKDFYYEKSYNLDPLELANFQIDESITGFKYATAIGNNFIYTPNGKADMEGLLDFSSYNIMPLEASSLDQVETLVENINSRLSLQNIKTSNVNSSKILINGEKAIEITMDVKDKDDRIGRVYQVAVFKEGSTSAIIFYGIDTNNGLYFDKIKATAKSIRF